MSVLPEFVRQRIETLSVDAIGYGAKDTGEMGGGAANAILVAAGPELKAALKSKLAKSPKRVGDVVVTESFNLKAVGIKWICHIISIIKHTPDGAYCPHPKRLYDGVLSACRLVAELGAESVAFSVLGTGEGRVPPLDAARYMLSATKAFQSQLDDRAFRIVFSLPSGRDYAAFRTIEESMRRTY